MKIGTNVLIGAVVAVAVIGIAGFFYVNGMGQVGTTGNAVGTTPTSSSQNIQGSQSTCTKLSDEPFASFSYLISSDPLSPDAQLALTGFSLSRTPLANGDTTIALTPTGIHAGYQAMTFTLHPGGKLYFIETSLGDDSSGGDVNLHDDTGVIVNASGCVIGQ